MKPFWLSLLFFCAFFKACLHSAVQSRPLTLSENFFVGGCAGLANISIGQPFIYAKNMTQIKEPISWNPCAWYRGYSIQAFGMIPLIATQMGVNGLLTSQNPSDSYTVKLIHAILAGVVSTAINAPTESAILYAQQNNTGFLKSLQEARYTPGIYSAACRNGLYAPSYLVVFPETKKFLQDHIKNPIATTVSTSIIVGLLTGILTHSFDTIATTLRKASMQKPPMLNTFPMRHELDALRYFLRHKPRDLFRGYLIRSSRIALSAAILAWTSETVTRSLLTYKNMKN